MDFTSNSSLLMKLLHSISSSTLKRLQATLTQNKQVLLPNWTLFSKLKTKDLIQKGLEPDPLYQKIDSGFKVFRANEKFKFVHGGEIPEFQIAYETWGTLNPKKDNVILLHTGLSASSHAKSHELNLEPGWWEKFIGPGLALDTDKFHIICTNVLGGCYGSTGPSSIDPSKGGDTRYATNFPLLTIFDMVRAQFKLLDHLGIDKLHASVGSSMGGMLSLASAAMYPERVGRLISISSAASSHPSTIAMRYAQRQVLMADPHWNEGFYYDSARPFAGMKLARYRSGPEWEQRFGRQRSKPFQSPSFLPDFKIESYLEHQGEKFCTAYDANSFLYISKAMDLFDIRHPLPTSENIGSTSVFEDQLLNAEDIEQGIIKGLANVKMPTLVLGVQSDLLFPINQQRELVRCLRQAGNDKVTFYELGTIYGHDSFLIDTVNIGSAVKGHLEIH